MHCTHIHMLYMNINICYICICMYVCIAVYICRDTSFLCGCSCKDGSSSFLNDINLQAPFQPTITPASISVHLFVSVYQSLLGREQLSLFKNLCSFYLLTTVPHPSPLPVPHHHLPFIPPPVHSS